MSNPAEWARFGGSVESGMKALEAVALEGVFDSPGVAPFRRQGFRRCPRGG